MPLSNKNVSLSQRMAMDKSGFYDLITQARSAFTATRPNKTQRQYGRLVDSPCVSVVCQSLCHKFTQSTAV